MKREIIRVEPLATYLEEGAPSSPPAAAGLPTPRHILLRIEQRLPHLRDLAHSRRRIPRPPAGAAASPRAPRFGASSKIHRQRHVLHHQHRVAIAPRKLNKTVLPRESCP